MVLPADIPIDELERRMRPGAWSQNGFLGEDERLEDVLRADRETLKELGLTPEDLAHSLERLLSATDMFWLDDSNELNLGADRMESARASIEAFEQTFGPVETQRLPYAWVHGWTDAELANKIDLHSSRERPMDRHGRLLGTWAIVGGRYEVYKIVFAGSQECPWSRSAEQACAWGSTDWAIRDRHRDLRMRGPSLIVHLIREHGFFEGPASPYRVDPRELAELLLMGPYSEA
jgi:hypothetical protein